MPTPGLLGYDSSMPTHYGLYFSSEVTLLYIVHIHISAVNTDVAHALGNLMWPMLQQRWPIIHM